MTAPSHRPTPAQLLLADDGSRRFESIADALRAAGHRVQRVSGAEAARTFLATSPCDLALLASPPPDGELPGLLDELRMLHPALPVVVLATPGSIAEAVAATARGVSAYLPAPQRPQEVLECVAGALCWAGTGSEAASGRAWCAEIVSQSVLMARVLAEARLVAATDASVLIRGESGTGKELLARAIHRASPRAGGPFVAINCGAIPEPLLESELFGHRRGAFTGAVSEQRGLVRQAHGGTLFLDEIGDMPLALQVKLLRMLQERVVRPVGSAATEPVDVRIVSATHRDLDRALTEGRFREDLYYRLNVVNLALPTLDQRREDVPLLAAHFLAAAARRYRRPCRAFAPDALAVLATTAWPGNVRQLQNVVEQACALSTTALIPRSLVERALHRHGMVSLHYADAKQRFEHDYLVGLLKLTAGNVSDAARLAGRNRTEFYRLLRRTGLNAELFRHPGEPDAPATGWG
ncbi:sigma 54-interacting transcriptional regulator [Thauera sp. CAU 1555]|uniref:Sigma 54-interacting transcriptional regulator n=1 Tax=Thauera sedimentorum TaxID=2767595 RepID=A0ABR9BE95_9RHOO|nr:sigma 54-interacting transcriptional regulator [Thauera sedimentorum]MBC9073757.1 sigma 54-interacting transcriptional regulator [Thauera sedimentorum]MBD8504676.1 sigma 54-interacting transcriptional regulator [Thauera sedimentorum]